MSNNIHGNDPVCPHCGSRWKNSKASDDVRAERRRQIEAEGWTEEHDDEVHSVGDLAMAGACYAAYAFADDDRQGVREILTFARASWPWGREWWKPKDTRRDLVRAAALLIAEIERLDRAALKMPNVKVSGAEPLLS